MLKLRSQKRLSVFSPVVFIHRGTAMTMITVWYPAGSVTVCVCPSDRTDIFSFGSLFKKGDSMQISRWPVSHSDPRLFNAVRAPDSAMKAECLAPPDSTWRCVMAVWLLWCWKVEQLLSKTLNTFPFVLPRFDSVWCLTLRAPDSVMTAGCLVPPD